MNRITIKYPPDYDGELHIAVEDVERGGYKYTFTHANAGTAWTTLVKAAQAILEQDRRRKL